MVHFLYRKRLSIRWYICRGCGYMSTPSQDTDLVPGQSKKSRMANSSILEFVSSAAPHELQLPQGLMHD